ncbi:MAG: IS3 family transposase [Prosthecobacter sp.]
MIQQLHTQTQASIRQICHVLQLPRSSFYHAAKDVPNRLEDRRLGGLIEEIFRRNRRRYGYRRIAQELKDHDIVCAPARLRRLMRQSGLRAIQPKNYLPKTSDGRADRPSANLLAQQAMPTKPNEAWAGDITFIPTASRWLYLAVVIDLGSRRIIGWSLDTHMRSELVVNALQQALQARPQARSQRTLFHSDRGSQYGSSAFRAVLAGAGMRQSMSARANPYDNAWTESFMGTLKREMLQGGCFEDATDARLELFDYIDAYYNNQRKHSAIGYLTPNQFETQHINLN